MQQAMPPDIVDRGLSFSLIIAAIITTINQDDVLASSAITRSSRLFIRLELIAIFYPG